MAPILYHFHFTNEKTKARELNKVTQWGSTCECGPYTMDLMSSVHLFQGKFGSIGNTKYLQDRCTQPIV